MEVKDRELSDLAHIDLTTNDPIDLFTQWHNEVKIFKKTFNSIVCLSTVNEVTGSQQCIPRGRHVLLRKYDLNGFLFFTDSRGRKSLELSKNPNTSMCIYWNYENDNNEGILRQVRIEGKVEVLSREETKIIYDEDPLHSKIRSYLCHQDSIVTDWNALKKRHDELLAQVQADKNSLPMPDSYIGYRLVPTWMDFYYSKNDFIADRIEFRKDEHHTWINRRLSA